MGVSQFLKNANKFVQTAKNDSLRKAIHKTEDVMLDSTIKGAKKSGKFVARNALTKTDENWTNLYTGYKPSTAATVAGAGIATAYGFADYGIRSNMIDKSQNDMTYVGQAPATTYDQVGNSKAPTLGASGDLTLALSKQRRG